MALKGLKSPKSKNLFKRSLTKQVSANRPSDKVISKSINQKYDIDEAVRSEDEEDRNAFYIEFTVSDDRQVRIPFEKGWEPSKVAQGMAIIHSKARVPNTL